MKDDELTADAFRALMSSKNAPAAFAIRKPPKNDPEHEMQCEIVSDFRRDYPQYAGLFYAIPNGGKLPYHKNKKGEYTSPQRMKLVREGLLKGVPDLHLAVARGDWHSMYLELKILPNQPSDEQRAFMERATKEKHYCVVIYTREQAREVLRNYLNLNSPKNQSQND